jgi:hypothetical protein
VSEGRPCPACGQPLLGWAVVEARDPGGGRDVVLERCESCGLGLVQGAGADMNPDERGLVAVANRRSWQAGLGASHWAAIDPAEREAYSNGVRKAIYRDPDGNEIGFGGLPAA